MQRQEHVLIPEPGSRILVLPDMHYPHHDADSIDLVLRAAKDVGVTQAIQLGDLLDFYSVSKWEKDPTFAVEVGGVGDEIRSALPLFNFLNSLKNGWVWLEGNHEIRWKAYVNKDPALRSVDFNILKLLDSVDSSILSNCRYLSADKRLVLNPNIVIEHGHLMARSLKPKAEYAISDDYPEQTSIIGHTHKIFSLHRIARGIGRSLLRSVHSVGHLSDETKQNYAKEPVRWWPGFMIITVYHDNSKNTEYDLHQVIIKKDSIGRPSFALWGKIYK